jgi:hypothetical protein
MASAGSLHPQLVVKVDGVWEEVEAGQYRTTTNDQI